MFSAVRAWAGFIRLCMWLFCVAGCLLAVACQTQPKTDLNETQVKTLHELGFHEVGSGWELDFDSRLLFDINASRLTDQSKDTVARVARVLKSIGIKHLRIEGYTDSTGTSGYNKKLSLRRAEAVAREMARNGLPYGNITTLGFGTANPVGSNSTRIGRAQNRRVAIIVPVK